MNLEDYQIENGIRNVPLGSWWEFFEYIKREYESSPAIIFRGQAEAKWKLWSSLDRLEKKHPVKKSKIFGTWRTFETPPTDRETHLCAFKELAKGKRGVNPPDIIEDNEWWALAQHHGLTTPFMDWTYSPFIALYFAVEDRWVQNTDDQAVEPEFRAVYAVATHLTGDSKGKDSSQPMPYMPRGEPSTRLVAQAGVLLRMPQGKHLEDIIREKYTDESTPTDRHARAILTQITIPGSNDERVKCLKYLDKMNINRSALFPDLDGAAKYVNRMWELDFDTLRGYLLRVNQDD